MCTAALKKEEVKEQHLGCGWKGGRAARVRVKVRVNVRVMISWPYRS